MRRSENQAIDMVRDGVTPDFDAAMLGIGGHVPLDRHRRIGRETFDLGQHPGPAGFEREQPGSAASVWQWMASPVASIPARSSSQSRAARAARVPQ
jgi:hypothetical protein